MNVVHVVKPLWRQKSILFGLLQLLWGTHGKTASVEYDKIASEKNEKWSNNCLSNLKASVGWWFFFLGFVLVAIEKVTPFFFFFISLHSHNSIKTREWITLTEGKDITRGKVVANCRLMWAVTCPWYTLNLWRHGGDGRNRNLGHSMRLFPNLARIYFPSSPVSMCLAQYKISYLRKFFFSFLWDYFF